MQLTSDAKKVLFVLYKEYKARRKQGLSRERSKRFDTAATVKENLFPDTSVVDLEDYLRELDRNDFTNNSYGSNTIIMFGLTDEGIAILENYPKDVFISVTDFIAKFIP